MKTLPFSNDYKVFLENIKAAIRSSQIKAALAVNETMLLGHWKEHCSSTR